MFSWVCEWGSQFVVMYCRCVCGVSNISCLPFFLSIFLPFFPCLVSFFIVQFVFAAYPCLAFLANSCRKQAGHMWGRLMFFTMRDLYARLLVFLFLLSRFNVWHNFSFTILAVVIEPGKVPLATGFLLAFVATCAVKSYFLCCAGFVYLAPSKSFILSHI